MANRVVKLSGERKRSMGDLEEMKRKREALEGEREDGAKEKWGEIFKRSKKTVRSPGKRREGVEEEEKEECEGKEIVGERCKEDKEGGKDGWKNCYMSLKGELMEGIKMIGEEIKEGIREQAEMIREEMGKLEEECKERERRWEEERKEMRERLVELEKKMEKLTREEKRERRGKEREKIRGEWMRG